MIKIEINFSQEVVETGIGLWTPESLVFPLGSDVGSLELQLWKLRTHLVLITFQSLKPTVLEAEVLRLQADRTMKCLAG